ncbi:hypothetical protein ES319_D02G035700v1 [Gossypium barbadense]|uniref:DUF7794 domain-containing protein n=1 Tax=Gossypium barbadense TaxID=3634 RepID=A0A5J5S8S3_GOSBA|nr:hypothetical protein ES319_D02G035700v1 [Gossypium barbadense]
MKIFHLFLISLLLFSFSKAESNGSVFFIDSSSHQFLRAQTTNDLAQILVVEPKNALFSKALKNSVDLGSSKADILFPDDEDLSMISLDHPLGDYCEEEINEFASWLGGSYATDVTKPLDGVLTIPLANGDNMNLHMSKKVHREFASKLFALYRNIRKAMERHEDLSQILRRPAELIMGSFDGIKHDTDGFDKQGMRLLLATLNRIFDLLQTTYEAIPVCVPYLHAFSIQMPRTL